MPVDPLSEQEKARQSRQAWSSVFRGQRSRQFQIARSRAWRALRRSFPQLVLFLIRYLWAAILVVALFALCWALASHRLAGLTPEAVARVTIQQDPPLPESHLKVTLIPPLGIWELNDGDSSHQEVDLDLENDGDQAGAFEGSLLASPGGCVRVNPAQVKLDEIAPHKVIPLAFQIDTSGCSIPVEISLRFHYQWTLSELPGKKARRIPADRNDEAESVQVPAASSAGASPMQLNLSIQLPPGARYSKAQAGKPERHYAGSLTTSPILITSAFAASVHRMLALGSSLASKFTWPLLIAFLTIVGQNTLARRSERQQIHNNRLDALTGLMQRHYLPITRRMETVILESQKLGDPGIDSAWQSQRIFAAILLMRRRILHLVSSKGGVFFPSPLAENIFTGGIGCFYGNFLKITEDADLCETLASSLDPDAMLFAAHEQIFPSFWFSNRTRDALTKFSGWIAKVPAPDNSLANHLVLLSLCEAVMLFEFDRVQYETQAPVFQHNYLDPPQFLFTEDINALPPFSGESPDTARQQFLGMCAKYFEGMPEESRPALIYPKP